MNSTILVIGGLDASGGAGILRDNATLLSLGINSICICTMVSAQSHSHYYLGEAVSARVFAAQLDAAFNNNTPSAIKIGALANNQQVDILCRRLRSWTSVPVVWDPVLTTTSGATLGTISHEAVAQLLPFVHLITPNINEFGWLTGETLSSRKALLRSAHTLLPNGVNAVLVKGGHSDDDTKVTDALFLPEKSWFFTHKHRYTFNLRGSGCLLSTAISAALAKHYVTEDAVTLAQTIVADSFASAHTATEHHATAPLPTWPSANSHWPEVSQGFTKTTPTLAFPPLCDAQAGLYPVVDSLEWLQTLLPLGVKLIQLRIKSSPPNLSEIIKDAVCLGRQYGAQLFINDHWQLAIEHGAYGVHLGQDDLKSAELRKISGAGLRLGISTHGYAELCRAKRFLPSYLALGHIFPTKTKKMPSQPQGLARLQSYVALCEPTPTVAIGGISIDMIKDIAETGVDNIAVVSAITGSHSPIQATQQLQKAIADAYA